MTEVKIKFRYAQSEKGGVVDIFGLKDTPKKELPLMSCLGCGDRVVAARGEIMTHHFRHYRETARTQNCSPESYLHKSAKMALQKALIDRAVSGQPLTLTREKVRKFTHLNSFSEVIKQGLISYDQDIISGYVDCKLEKAVGDFIPDVLLLTETNHVFFEVAVTSPCSDEKIRSGNRIIEFRVKNEEDISAMLKMISDGHIHDHHDMVITHNFPCPEELIKQDPPPTRDMLRSKIVENLAYLASSKQLGWVDIDGPEKFFIDFSIEDSEFDKFCLRYDVTHDFTLSITVKLEGDVIRASTNEIILIFPPDYMEAKKVMISMAKRSYLEQSRVDFGEIPKFTMHSHHAIRQEDHMNLLLEDLQNAAKQDGWYRSAHSVRNNNLINQANRFEMRCVDGKNLIVGMADNEDVFGIYISRMAEDPPKCDFSLVKLTYYTMAKNEVFPGSSLSYEFPILDFYFFKKIILPEFKIKEPIGRKPVIETPLQKPAIKKRILAVSRSGAISLADKPYGKKIGDLILPEDLPEMIAIDQALRGDIKGIFIRWDDVKSCLLCPYHTFRNNKSQVHCMKRGQGCFQNAAVSCNMYRRFFSKANLQSHRQKMADQPGASSLAEMMTF